MDKILNILKSAPRIGGKGCCFAPELPRHIRLTEDMVNEMIEEVMQYNSLLDTIQAKVDELIVAGQDVLRENMIEEVEALFK